MSDATLSNLLHESRRYAPPACLVADTNVSAAITAIASNRL